LSTAITRRTQAERSATTRAALLAAARDLFAERGFAATGRDDIAARAGVTRGALYHHFDSKEAVLRALVVEMEAELVDHIAKTVRGTKPGLEQLRAGALAYIDACADPAMQRITLLEAPAVLGWADCREITASTWLRSTEEALALATGRRSDDPDIEITANLLLGALSEAVMLLATSKQPARTRRRIATNFSAFLDRLVAA
jgi:AcrR family transcriptional regulator